MRAVLLPPLFLLGCYEPPELPIEGEVPVVAANACASDRTEEVICVLDGDTFDVDACGEFGERIRMLGVDAPEIAHDPEPADCYGDDAHSEVIRLIEGDRVLLTFDEECQGVFGRTLAYVWLTGSAYDRLAIHPDAPEYTREVPGDGTTAILLNEWLVGQGYAYVFPEEQFGRILWQDDLEAAEDRARTLGRGVWGECVGGTSTASSPSTAILQSPADGPVARESE